MLGETRLIDIGLIAAARWLDADRLWALQIGYRASASAASAGLRHTAWSRSRRWGSRSGRCRAVFAALIRPDGGLIFMGAAGLSVRTFIGDLLSESTARNTLMGESSASGIETVKFLPGVSSADSQSTKGAKR